jgi:glycosyltransferase involved in cell wall biosynthesis
MGRTAYVLGQLPRVLARRDEPLFHAVGNFNLPFLRISRKRFVLTVHDLIPELLPDTVSLAFRAQFRLWLARSLHVADHVICVSAATARDLRRLYPTVHVPMSVVHHGVDHVAEATPGAEEESWYRGLALPTQHFLYAGALDARKNVELLLEAAERLWSAGRQVALVLVGQKWFGSSAVERRVARLRKEGRDVRTLGYQPAARLYRLMQGATAFVFPSRYEGFGLPPLEAMRLGTPVVISSEGALPEVCGEAGLQVSLQGPEPLAAALAHLLDFPDERRRRVEAGRRWAEHFTWKRTAEATREIYAGVLQGGGN